MDWQVWQGQPALCERRMRLWIVERLAGVRGGILMVGEWVSEGGGVSG